ncbi:MAG: hypothetical protein ACH346_01720 [Chthoniobacterales bacterium]
MFDLHLTSAHLHLALNHIPIIGIAVSCLPIVIGILAQSRMTMAAGLLATLLCAAAVPTIMDSGSKAAHAFRDGTMQPPLDEAGKIAMHIHGGHAHQTAPVIYASAILAVLALLALIKFPRPATWLCAAVLIGNAISIAMAVWTADAGGHIRHLELRPATPWDKPTISAPTPTGAATTPLAPSSETPSSETPSSMSAPALEPTPMPSTSTTP